MFFDAFLLGLCVSMVTQVLKKLTPKVGKDNAKFVVFGIVFVFTIVLGLVVKFTPSVYLQFIIGSYATAIAVYETILKAKKEEVVLSAKPRTRKK